MERMRLPDDAHTSRPWRIHEIAPDFRLQDVWALPTPGGAGDFPRLVALMPSFDSSSPLVRALFAIRWTVGRLLRPDRDHAVSPPGRVPLDAARHRAVVAPFVTLTARRGSSRQEHTP